MAHTIVIIGGLSDDADRNALLAELRERSGPEIEWDWVKGAENDGYNPPHKPLNRLLARLTSLTDPYEGLRVVKLFRLHGRVVSQLHRVCRDPVLAPEHIDSQEGLVEWLFSPEANLIPRREWRANLEEVALVAVLAKLVKNKSWNKDTQGHAWTKEENLLGQAPVYRPEFPEIAREAAKMLSGLRNVLLLCKGRTQGKTPRGWSIRLQMLDRVKQTMIEQSLDPLLAVHDLTSIAERIRKHGEKPYRLDGDIVTERIRQLCRDRPA